jgi:hypothetical protein
MTKFRTSGSILEFSSLSYTVKPKKTQTKVLVDDVSFSMQAGDMLGESYRMVPHDREGAVVAW